MYKCEKCQDAGTVYPVIDGKVNYSLTIPCPNCCLGASGKRQQNLIKYCQLPERLQGCTFDNFKTYNDPNLIKALELSKRIADGEKEWLTLLSEPDKGKSHLAAAICNYRLSQGKVSKFAVVTEMLEELRASIGLEGIHSTEFKLNIYKEVPLLVLDDLGQGKYSEWGREQFFTIINYRYNARLPLVVTSMHEIDRMFGAGPEMELDNMAISSRLQREKWCHVVIIDTKEHRMRR